MRILALSLSLLAAQLVNGQRFIAQVRPAGSELWGYVTSTGDMIVPPTYKGCFRFTESGYAAVMDPAGKNGAFINAKGERLATEVGDFHLISSFGGGDVQGFSCGLAPVKVGELWGFMDTRGKLVVPASYEKVDAFESCLAAVMKGKKLYILKSDGQAAPVADPAVVDVKSFVDGLAPFKTKDKMHGFMNGDQQMVIPATFHSVGYFSGGLAWAKDRSEKVGFIDKKGAWVIPPTYDAAKEMDATSGLARVKRGDVWMYVDRNGRELLPKGTTDHHDFSEGLAEARQGDLVGFIGTDGSWVIPARFQGARAFKNGFAAAKQGDRWGYINTKGEWVLQPAYDAVKDMERVP